MSAPVIPLLRLPAREIDTGASRLHTFPEYLYSTPLLLFLLKIALCAESAWVAEQELNEMNVVE